MTIPEEAKERITARVLADAGFYELTGTLRDLKSKYNPQEDEEEIKELFFTFMFEELSEKDNYGHGSLIESCDSGIKRLIELFKQKYEKPEVHFADLASKTLFQAIERVVVRKYKLSSDDTMWDFHIKDDELGVNGKISIPARRVEVFNSFSTEYLNTFDIPTPKLTGKKWNYLLIQLCKHKMEKTEARDESDLLSEARFVFEDICKLDITSDEIDSVIAGRAMYDHDGVYLITTNQIRKIIENLGCAYSRKKIADSLVELGLKVNDSPNPTLNKKNYRCWSFVKKAVDEATGQSNEQNTKLQNS